MGAVGPLQPNDTISAAAGGQKLLARQFALAILVDRRRFVRLDIRSLELPVENEIGAEGNITPQ